MTCSTCGARPPLWLRLAVRLVLLLAGFEARRRRRWIEGHYADSHDPMTEPWGDL